MLHFQKSLFKGLANKSVCNFGFGKQKPPTPKNLDKYDVVFIGSNIGGICSNHFEKATKMKYKCFVAFENAVNEVYPLRGVYETQRMSKTDYLPNAKLSVHTNSASSDLIGVKEIQANNNKIVLNNGREIEYEQLVIAAGLKANIDAIKGFDAAWEHETHPVYAPGDHPRWSRALHKYPKYHYNFWNGDAYFCIPKFPFAGEVECYNFFISHDVWQVFKSHGKQHPHAKLTILNANDKFVQFNEEADNFIKTELEKRGIEVIYNVNLEEVNMNNYEITTKNLQTGETAKRDYNNLYSLIPSQRHEFLDKAGLTASNGLLDVDRHTLQHNKYKNIFGLGDCANIPTTPSFWGGWQQIHVVRNNVERNLNGQSLNGLYDGYSKNPIYTSQTGLTFSEHLYDEKACGQHLKNGNNFIGSIKNKLWIKQSKKFLDYYRGKTWGPPYHKFPKNFKELPAEQEKKPESTLKVEKKSA